MTTFTCKCNAQTAIDGRAAKVKAILDGWRWTEDAGWLCQACVAERIKRNYDVIKEHLANLVISDDTSTS